MNQHHYQIRTMTRDELALAIDWAAVEGWNPGLYDLDSFLAADPSGFLIGLLDGEPIACISAVQYGEHFGFIGFYIVKPAYREQGYGIQIWQAAIDRLAGRTVGLDGVVSQQGNYRKFGFQLAYQNIRYQGMSTEWQQPSAEIVAITECPWEAITQFDRNLFTAARSDFLASWLTQPESHAFACLEQGQVAGYGMVRVCRSGFKIGPLFAKTPVQANLLLQALQGALPPGSVYYLDMPAINTQTEDWVQRYALQPVFETARMYLGKAPDTPIQQVYGVTSFELG